MRCGCGFWVRRREVLRLAGDCGRRVWWRRGAACGGSMCAGSSAAALRAVLGAGVSAAEERACAGGGRDGAGGVVRCRGGRGGPAAAGASITLRWTGCRGASWCRTLRRRGHRCAAGGVASLPARGTSFRRWAQRLLAHARRRRACRRASVLARDAERAGAVAGRWGGLIAMRDISGHGAASAADAAGFDHGRAADAGGGGVPWRHQRGAADRPGGCGCGLVPAARPRRRHRRC